MQHQRITCTLGRQTAHRISMLRNLSTSLIIHKKIQTTEMRARELSRFVEKLVTWAKQKDLAGKREVFRHIKNRDAAKELFDEIAPRYDETKGGYTRVTKAAIRKGDGATVCVVEFA